MKTESAGLSREELRARIWDAIGEPAPPFEGKQAEPEYCHAQKDGDCDWTECPQLKNYQDHCPLDISGKQAEPPSQPAFPPHSDAHHFFCDAPKSMGPCNCGFVAESPSQASTRPKCNCGAGDDAYLACHADVCALKKWAAPRYEISQATKEAQASTQPPSQPAMSAEKFWRELHNYQVIVRPDDALTSIWEFAEAYAKYVGESQ